MLQALLLVDLQNDFFLNGALAVQEAEQVLSVANGLMLRFPLVVASQDWHPKDHQSFANFHKLRVGEIINLHGIKQVLWPTHCIQNTDGAAFHPQLNIPAIQHVVRKGTNPKLDSYSAFFENDQKTETGLTQYLIHRQVETLFILGLATDYCVKYSVLDARALGFEVHLVVDGCRAVNLHPTDEQEALKAMEQAGAKLINSDAVHA